MKCKEKDCKDCVHYIDIRTHKLFRDFIIKQEDGKQLDFTGCIFHLNTLFLRQIWVRMVGSQSAIESHRNYVGKGIQELNQSLRKAINTSRERDLLDERTD